MEEQLKARLIGASVLVLLAVVLIPELLSARKPASEAADPADSAHGMRTYTIELGGAAAAGTKLAPVPTAARPLPTSPKPTVDKSAATLTDSAEPGAAVPPEPQPKPASRGPEATAKPSPGTKPVQVATTAPARVTTPAPASVAAPAPASSTPKTVSPETAQAARSSAAAAKKGQWAVQVGAFGSSSSANKLIGDLKRAGFSAYESPLTRSGKTLHRVRVGPEAERTAADQLATRLKGRGLPATVVAND